MFPWVAYPANRPAVASEWDFVYPDEYRAEGAILTSAILAFQGFSAWDRYTWGHYGKQFFWWRQSNFATSETVIFDAWHDPINQYSTQIASLMFQRGDVTPSKYELVIPYTSEMELHPKEYGNLSDELHLLSALHRIRGSRSCSSALFQHRDGLASILLTEQRIDGNAFFLSPDLRKSEDILPALLSNEKTWNWTGRQFGSRADLLVSDTGEMHWNTRSSVWTLDAPRIQAIEGFIGGETIETTGLKVTSINKFGVVAAISLNDEPLSKTQRALIGYFTDCIRKGDAVSNGKAIELKGYPPDMMIKCNAAINLKHDSDIEVFSLSPSGAREKSLPLKRTGKWIGFETLPGAMLYEVVAKGQ